MPVAATLQSITAEEDDTVVVGGELAKIGEQGAAAAEQPAPKPEPEPAPEPKPAPEPRPAAAASAPSAESGPYVTPLVRKLANENNSPP